ncbi:MAG TPA: 30S ribosomal protein S4 [Polyangiaceae bacterium LLY-WYZ-15_(1-7)]|nr:30S ribosomal protein S4 [Myxococcales bacterium]MAT27099.1 30S ribosomal protein S4 [Sandaracinus sp.]HJK92970.1 30S ribosomal protein S4 [Polyangiaceae bacterium LLY-WYZ-15_(1-7)]MBJ73209.1 30S ribosomal protein S4 [Sandaracinus sp.]HJL00322.1 30S ribosomal protein S4 [Polyangiaceae bacterium LLY-WYZ-15_(1-7)]
MSRYTGPRVKKMRALGIDLPGLSRKTMWERAYPPGEHGPRNARRRRESDFKKQLVEKQKLRFNYGLTEKQFRRLFVEAKRDKAPTPDKLLEFLERRLDNAVFRAGFAPTIPAARQLVRHRHIRVNGKRVDIPSFRVSVGDEITVRDKSKELAIVKESLEKISLQRPEWMRFDEEKLVASMAELPTKDAVPFPVEMQLIVEYYSKRL